MNKEGLVSVLRLSAGSTKSGEDGLSRIQVGMVGDFEHAWFGKFSINRGTFEAFVANFNARTNKRLPFDRDHAGGPAAGWIYGLEIDENDNLFALVKWTKRGKQEIEDEEYQYTSMTFSMNYVDKYSRELGPYLHGVTLTNDPFLDEMETVSCSAGPAEWLAEGADTPAGVYALKRLPARYENAHVSNTVKTVADAPEALAEAESDRADAEEEVNPTITAEAEVVVESAPEAPAVEADKPVELTGTDGAAAAAPEQGEPAGEPAHAEGEEISTVDFEKKFRAAVGLSDDVDLDQYLAVLTEASKLGLKSPDGKDTYIPLTKFAAVQSEVRTMQTKLAKATGDLALANQKHETELKRRDSADVVAQAISDGKLTIEEANVWGNDLAFESPERFSQIIASRPQFFNVEGEGDSGDAKNTLTANRAKVEFMAAVNREIADAREAGKSLSRTQAQQAVAKKNPKLFAAYRKETTNS
jgi:phage I-like protein